MLCYFEDKQENGFTVLLIQILSSTACKNWSPIMRSTACNSASLQLHLWKIQPRNVCKGSFAMSPRGHWLYGGKLCKAVVRACDRKCTPAPPHVFVKHCRPVTSVSSTCFVTPFQMYSFWGLQFSHMWNGQGHRRYGWACCHLLC